jgi:protein gp37
VGQDSAISWTNHTFNPWWGCTRVGGSRACDDCYAEALAHRYGFDVWGADKPRRVMRDEYWMQLAKWNRMAQSLGYLQRVFVMSMGDWAEGRPEQKPILDRLWKAIACTDHLLYLMLTKRPQLIRKLCPIASSRVWQGATAEDQSWLGLRWAHLQEVDVAGGGVWLSVEPMLERMTLPKSFLDRGSRAWVVVGGKSGAHITHLNLDWARSLRDQCREAGVLFHMKQTSQDYGKDFKTLESFPADLRIREVPE